jgi:hypothetical protein
MAMLNVKTAAALCVVAALTACGGSSGGDSTITTADSAGVPQSALQSVTGLVTYLEDLIARTSETAEPVTLGDVVLPTSETL